MALFKGVVLNLAVLLGIGLVLSTLAIPVAENAPALRDPGTVGQHYDSAELVERAIWDNVKFLYKSIFTLALTGIVCSSAAATTVVGAVGCVLTSFRNTGGANAGGPAARSFINAGTTNWLDYHEHHYPGIIGGPSGITQMMTDYNGSSLRVATCRNPDVPSCNDVTYQNYPKLTGGLIHHLSVSPASRRGKLKRDCNGCGYEGSTYEDDGTTEFFADYYFDTGNVGDENSMGNDDTDGGLAQHWVNTIQAQSDPDPTQYYGFFCSNIALSCDQASVRFMTTYPYELHLDQDNITANFETCQQSFND